MPMGLRGLAQPFPTAAQGTRLVPGGEEAIMPETHEAAGQPMQEEAADQCVGVARPGRDTMARTTMTGGKAAPPSRPSRIRWLARATRWGERPTESKTCAGPARGALA